MVRRRSRQWAIGFIPLWMMASLLAMGCPKSAYHSAVVANHDFKEVVKAFQKAEIVEFQNGRVDAAEHKLLEGGIEKVALTGQTLTASLQAGASNTTVQQNFDTVSQAVTDLLNNGVLALKNSQSQQLLKVSIQTGQAILANVVSLLHLQTTTTLPAATGGN